MQTVPEGWSKSEAAAAGERGEHLDGRWYCWSIRVGLAQCSSASVQARFERDYLLNLRNRLRGMCVVSTTRGAALVFGGVRWFVGHVVIQ